MSKRTHETARLTPGQRVTYSGFPGAVVRLYADGPCEGARMYEVRLQSGTVCVTGADLIPRLPIVAPSETNYRRSVRV
jgi:hypothetical protein